MKKALFTILWIIVGSATAGDANAGPLILAAAGAAIGWGISGGVALAAQVGWMVGGMIGSAIFAEDQHFEQPQLSDLRVQGTEYGQPIPWILGHPRIAGQIWWASAKKPVAHTSSSGGKGGGSQTSTTYTYDIDLLIGLCDNTIENISRIWSNGKLVYSNSSTSDAAAVTGTSEQSEWERITIYKGDETQLPDSVYEEAVGVGNAPAYIDRGTVFFKNLHLDGSGNLTNLTFEVVASGSAHYGSLLSDKSVRLTDAINPYWIESTGGTACRIGDSIYFSTVWFYNWDGTQGYHYSWRYDISSGVLQKIGSHYLAHYPQSIINGNTDTPCFGIIYTGSPRTYAIVKIPSYKYAYFTGYTAITGDAAIVYFCRRGSTVFFTMSPSSGNNYIFKYTMPLNEVGTVSAHDDYVQRTTSASYVQLVVAGDYLYATLNLSGSGKIDVFDVATLTYQKTINYPIGTWWGGAHSITIYAGDTGNLWCTNMWSGGVAEKETWELVEDVWVVRAKAGGINFGGGGGIYNGGRMFQYGTSVFAVTHTLSTDSPGGSTWAHVQRVGPIGASTSGELTIQQTVTLICSKTELPSTLFDASALSTITMPMRAFANGQLATGRVLLEIFAGPYFYEMSVSDKLYIKPRGAAIVVTIPYEDLGIDDGGKGDSEPFVIHQRTDIEFPAQKTLSYLNVSNDYLPDVQPSDRMISALSDTIENVQVSLAFTPTEAKSIIDADLMDKYMSLVDSQISLPSKYAMYEPSDVFGITDKNGYVHRMRAVKRQDNYPRLSFDVVRDDSSVLSSTGVTDTGYTSASAVKFTPYTEAMYLDMPILQDVDSNFGFYVAAKGRGTGWVGCNTYSSNDDVAFNEDATVLEATVMGYASDALGNWVLGRVWDLTNSVTVQVGNDVLNSSTRAAVLNDKTINALLIGNEVLQFVTATLISQGVYTLTEFLRGDRGTEQHTASHAVGDRVVKLQKAGLRRINWDAAQLGFLKYMRSISLDRNLDSDVSTEFTNTGIGKKPFAPFDARVIRNSPSAGDITIIWQRRTRLSYRAIGASGIYVPLGETSEMYDVLFYTSGTYGTLKRTITATTTSVTYTNAQQTADGLTPPAATVWFRIHQRSPEFGLGYKLEGAL